MLADRSRRERKRPGSTLKSCLLICLHRSEDRMRVFCIDMNIGQG